MRIPLAFLLSFCLAACNRGLQTKEAVRQGIIEYLQGRQMNISSMDIAVTSVQFHGDRADATVGFTPKEGGPSQAISMQYQLEQRGGKWVVLGHMDMGATPHGGGAPRPGPTGGGGEAAAPGAANPHGAQMPAPENLPPAGQKE